MSNDLFDNNEMLSLDDVVSSTPCKYCGEMITTDILGEVTNSGCTMECGDGAYLSSHDYDIVPDLNFNDD